MKNYIPLILIFLLVLGVNAQDNLKISSAEVSFVFVNNDVAGTLTGFTSSSSIDLAHIENSSFKGAVDVKTISTGNSLRNWSLRRGKYFDVDNYPKITFESTSVEKQEDTFIVKGKLTIKEVTKEVTFNFEKSENMLIGKTSLYSSDYGISIKKNREKNKVLVKLVFQLK